MIDKYVILNRKPRLIIGVFIIQLFLLTGFIIWGINTFTYQNYSLFHSRILSHNSYYLLEVLIPVKEVNQVMNQNLLWIDDTKYNYRFIKKDNVAIYRKKNNYVKIYLEVFNLDNVYLIDGYNLDIRICLSSDRIINLLKNKEEYS